MMNQILDYDSAFALNLTTYLRGKGEIDEQLPDAPDIAELWGTIGEAYLPDGMREFEKYPTVSLGWMMYVGMAVAKYWDVDWELYSKVDNLYTYLRDRIDFDHLDDYVRTSVLLLNEEQATQLQKIVAECAGRIVNQIRHMSIEPGTENAFRAFFASLHQMYLMGAAMQLKRMGYHMTKIG